MKISPTLRYRRFLPASVALLGGFVMPGCDQKLGGDVPMTPEMQKKWRAAERQQYRAIQTTPGAVVLPPIEWTQILKGDAPEENHDSSED